MEKRLSNIFKTTNVRKLIKAILKFYKLHLKKGDQKVRLVSKDHWISSCFYYLNLHFGEKCETRFLQKPTGVSQNLPTFISIGLPDTKKKDKTFIVLFGCSFISKKNCWDFQFFIFQIFEQRFVIFEKLRYMSQLLLKLQVVKVATAFNWISTSTKRATLIQ